MLSYIGQIFYFMNHDQKRPFSWRFFGFCDKKIQVWLVWFGNPLCHYIRVHRAGSQLKKMSECQTKAGNQEKL